MRSSIARVVKSGMMRTTIFGMCGAPPKYAGFASYCTLCARSQRTNLYGPVPIGCVLKSARSSDASCSSRCCGSTRYVVSASANTVRTNGA